MVHAAEVAAGMPFMVKLTLQSHSALLQTLEVILKDSTGFVTSGQNPLCTPLQWHNLSGMTHMVYIMWHDCRLVHTHVM